jgi:hypothetical protein
MLYSLCFAKQALLHAHLLQAPISSTHEVTFSVSIGTRSLTKVIGIVANIPTLGLDFTVPSVSIVSMKYPATPRFQKSIGVQGVQRLTIREGAYSKHIPMPRKVCQCHV